MTHWCKSQQQQIIIKKQELQPDITIINKQIEENKVFMCNIEYKKSIIESSLTSAKLYYDDRVKFIELSTDDTLTENDTNNLEETSQAINSESQSNLSLSKLKKRLSSRKKKNENKLKISEDAEKDSSENQATGKYYFFNFLD